MSEAYFERVGPGLYRPTSHSDGAWNPGEIHFSPLGGLIAHEIDLHRASAVASGADDKRLARISFDILGFLASDLCEVAVETIRPGRTIELVEATVTIGGRRAVLARAWFISPTNTAAVEGGAPELMAGPESGEPWAMSELWSGGYVASLDVSVLQGRRSGRGQVWMRTDVNLVAGEPSSRQANFIMLTDTANGVAVRDVSNRWVFPNLDLTVHLYREPEFDPDSGRDWVGFDTTVTFGPDGRGLTSTALHDSSGPVGRAEQVLTVRPSAGG